jgi:hypothetical protein
MRFLHPQLLWFLFGIVVPVIIHLLQLRRYKTLFFSNTAFLNELLEKRNNRDKLRRRVLLASRIILITATILAFSEPYIPGEISPAEEGRGVVYSFYLDNSLSMEVRGEEGSLLDRGKVWLEEVLGNLNESDKIQLLSNAFSPESYRELSPSEALSFLSGIKSSPISRDIGEVMLQQSDFLKRNGGGRAVLISNFRRGIYSLPEFKPDSLFNFSLVPIKPQRFSNLYIDSLWFESPELLPGKDAVVLARVVNMGEEWVNELSVYFKMNEQSQVPANIDIAPGGKEIARFSFRVPDAGWHKAEMYVQDNAWVFDDSYYFSLNVREQIRVNELSGKSASLAIQKIMGRDSLFLHRNFKEGGFDLGQLEQSDLLFLNECEALGSAMQKSILQFVERGGTAFIIPPRNWAASSMSEFAKYGIPVPMGTDTVSTRILPIQENQPMFKDVFDRLDPKMDMPLVMERYRLPISSVLSSEHILTFVDGMPALQKLKLGEGFVYVLSFSLHESWSTLTRHALFVPLMLKTAFSSIRPIAPSYVLSSSLQFPIPFTGVDLDAKFELRHLESGTQWMASRRSGLRGWSLQIEDGPKEAGFYEVLWDEKPCMTLGLNYDRKESDLSPFSFEEWVNALESLGFKTPSIAENTDAYSFIQQIKMQRGDGLWRYFIVLALLALGLEIAIIRLWKK